MNLPAQPILGLIDGIEILQYLASTDGEISGVEIARELNIEKTKVNRILKTFAYLGFVQPAKSRKYTLGPAIHVLSAQLLHGSGLIKSALKYLIELTNLNVIVAMGVLWHNKVAYTYHWQPGILPTEGVGRVELFPASQSSIGMILCAQKNTEELDKIMDYSEEVPGFSSKLDFIEEVNRTRERGYAMSVYQGKTSIAVKLGSPAYAAIALADIDMTVSVDYYLEILREKAALIEKAKMYH